MVMLRTNGQIVSLRGRFGGTYYKTDKGIIHQQAMPRKHRKAWMQEEKIYEHSPGANAAARTAAFTIASLITAIIMVLGALAVWVTFAIAHHYKTKKGDWKKINWRQWMLHFNINRAAKELPCYTWPPISPTELPQLVVTGTYWMQSVQNMYEEKTLMGGKPWYTKQVEPLNPKSWALWYREGTWYMASYPEWPLVGMYWEKTGESPLGEYTPSQPIMGPMKVHL